MRWGRQALLGPSELEGYFVGLQVCDGVGRWGGGVSSDDGVQDGGVLVGNTV